MLDADGSAPQLLEQSVFRHAEKSLLSCAQGSATSSQLLSVYPKSPHAETIYGDMIPTLTLLPCDSESNRYAHNAEGSPVGETFSRLMSRLAFDFFSASLRARRGYTCPLSPPHTRLLFLHPPLAAAIKLQTSRMMNEAAASGV